MWLFINVFEKMFQRRIDVEFMIDSQPVRDLLVNGWYESDPGLQGVLDYCVDQLRSLNATVYYVHTQDMLADELTKFIKVS